jgi:hypothetical protein
MHTVLSIAIASLTLVMSINYTELPVHASLKSTGTVALSNSSMIYNIEWLCVILIRDFVCPELWVVWIGSGLHLVLRARFPCTTLWFYYYFEDVHVTYTLLVSLIIILMMFM